MSWNFSANFDREPYLQSSLFDMVSANELYERDGIFLYLEVSRQKNSLKREEAGKQLRGEPAKSSIYCISSANHAFWYAAISRKKMKQLSQFSKPRCINLSRAGTHEFAIYYGDMKSF